MMRTLSDLPEVLVQEIFSKVPLTSLNAVRSTCKTWNALSQHQIFAKTKNQTLGFMVINSRLFSLKLDLRDEGDLVCPSTKPVSMLNYVDIYNVYHCDGLLLCVIRDNRWRVVWNPYTGDTRWIEPIHKYHRFQKSDMFAFGYDNNNRNHKILRFLDVSVRSNLPLFFEIYDFSSNSWRVLDVNPECHLIRGVSLKGNTYFFARQKKNYNVLAASDVEVFLLCFDFTTERFGPRLPLPFQFYFLALEHEALSCVRDEHLALLYQRYDFTMEIWITTEVEPDRVSWSSFFRVDLKPFPERFYGGSFFIDEEKKVALVVDFRGSEGTSTSCYQTAYIIGEDEYLKSVRLGEAPNLSPNICGRYNPLVVSSYVPSLVQLQINQGRKRKERDY